MNDPFRLDGRVAVITGSTRGIGLATAKLMLRVGARVVISSRKADACEAVRAQLAAEGADVLAVPCHMAKDEERVALIDRTIEAWGRIDILVVNAAVNPVFVTMDELDPETWSKVLDTNLTGAWRLAQRAYPHMVKQGGGSMVLLSSLAGQLAALKGGAYAVSKAGVDHLGRQLAAEWGPQQIRVNVVAPGTTRTDMIRAIVSNEKVMKAVERQAPLRRIGEPEDVAAAILFLASDAARHITGQLVNVDGGATLTGQLT